MFLTEYGAPAHVFDALAPQFKDTFRVVALTRRGRAPSAAPSTGYDLETLTSDVKGLLDENTSHYLFRDREADVVREMKAFYSSLRR